MVAVGRRANSYVSFLCFYDISVFIRRHLLSFLVANRSVVCHPSVGHAAARAGELDRD